MPKSLGDATLDARDEWQTHGQTKEDFKPGMKVLIICSYEDEWFWYEETGTVLSTDRGHDLDIEVLLDESRHFENGRVQTKHNFNPENLYIIKIGDYIA